jgi:hypothetical protein
MVVGTAACGIWASALVGGTEAAVLTSVVLLVTAGALFGDSSEPAGHN